MLAIRAAADSNRSADHDTSKKHQQLVTGPVVIYNVFCLLPVDKALAANYVYAKYLFTCFPQNMPEYHAVSCAKMEVRKKTCTRFCGLKCIKSNFGWDSAPVRLPRPLWETLPKLS